MGLKGGQNEQDAGRVYFRIFKWEGKQACCSQICLMKGTSKAKRPHTLQASRRVKAGVSVGFVDYNKAGDFFG